jgi:hypothetical protein
LLWANLPGKREREPFGRLRRSFKRIPAIGDTRKIHDVFFYFGQAGDVPVVADWDSTGWQRIGVFRAGQWWLDLNGDHMWDAIHDQVFRYGIAGDVPVICDWTHSFQTRIGVFRKSQWWLDMNGDHIWDPAHDIAPYFGIASDIPVVAQ